MENIIQLYLGIAAGTRLEATNSLDSVRNKAYRHEIKGLCRPGYCRLCKLLTNVGFASLCERMWSVQSSVSLYFI